MQHFAYVAASLFNYKRFLLVNMMAHIKKKNIFSKPFWKKFCNGCTSGYIKYYPKIPYWTWLKLMEVTAFHRIFAGFWAPLRNFNVQCVQALWKCTMKIYVYTPLMLLVSVSVQHWTLTSDMDGLLDFSFDIYGLFIKNLDSFPVDLVIRELNNAEQTGATIFLPFFTTCCHVIKKICIHVTTWAHFNGWWRLCDTVESFAYKFFRPCDKNYFSFISRIMWIM